MSRVLSTQSSDGESACQKRERTGYIEGDGVHIPPSFPALASAASPWLTASQHHISWMSRGEAEAALRAMRSFKAGSHICRIC